MVSIYLDDQRTPIEHPNNGKWTVVRNHADFCFEVERIGMDNIDIISFDHDLDPSATTHFFNHTIKEYQIDYSQIEEKTGYHSAMWLIEYARSLDMNLPQCYVHSANPIGAANIMGPINLYNYLRRIPQSCIRVRWKHYKE